MGITGVAWLPGRTLLARLRGERGPAASWLAAVSRAVKERAQRREWELSSGASPECRAKVVLAAVRATSRPLARPIGLSRCVTYGRSACTSVASFADSFSALETGRVATGGEDGRITLLDLNSGSSLSADSYRPLWGKRQRVPRGLSIAPCARMHTATAATVAATATYGVRSLNPTFFRTVSPLSITPLSASVCRGEHRQHDQRSRVW